MNDPTRTADEAGRARPVVGMYSFFSPDPARNARFWAELMGLPVAPGATDDLVMLDLDHEVAPQTWIFQRAQAAAGVAPVGLDIGIDDESWSEIADRAESLGAERVRECDDGGVRWIEMEDLDRNRFRVFAPRPVGS